MVYRVDSKGNRLNAKVEDEKVNDLVVSPMAESSIEQPQIVENFAMSDLNPKTWSTMQIVIVVLVLLALVGGGVYLYKRRGAGDAAAGDAAAGDAALMGNMSYGGARRRFGFKFY